MFEFKKKNSMKDNRRLPWNILLKVTFRVDKKHMGLFVLHINPRYSKLDTSTNSSMWDNGRTKIIEHKQTQIVTIQALSNINTTLDF